MSKAHELLVSLQTEQPFDLALVATSHGWGNLAPHEWDADSGRLSSAVQIGRSAADLQIEQARQRIKVRAWRRSPWSKLDRQRLVAQVKRILQLKVDLRPFWKLCRQHPRLAWVAQRGAGRMICAPTLFEDLLKLLFTTNCSWGATKGMNARLLEVVGARAPSGRRAFPNPAQVIRKGQDLFLQTVRAGYRSQACFELAQCFQFTQPRSTDLEDANRATDELRAQLLALRGFGPYAAGQALRLLGRFDDLALDSWCRHRLAQIAGRKKPPSDRTVARRYQPFAPYQGLALWLDLTAQWHGEGQG
jgi:N-glycosylase/DNA lyase